MPQHNERVAKNTKDLDNLGNPDPPSEKKYDIKVNKKQDKTEKKEVPKTINNEISEKPKPKTPKASRILSSVSKHFGLKGTEKGLTVKNPDDKKIKDDVNDIETKFNKNNNQENLMCSNVFLTFHTFSWSNNWSTTCRKPCQKPG